MNEASRRHSLLDGPSVVAFSSMYLLSPRWAGGELLLFLRVTLLDLLSTRTPL